VARTGMDSGGKRASTKSESNAWSVVLCIHGAGVVGARFSHCNFTVLRMLRAAGARVGVVFHGR